jgi:hypothetical protein
MLNRKKEKDKGHPKEKNRVVVPGLQQATM